MTKRQHALHELLVSERAYASDLARIREVHIPLALAELAVFSDGFCDQLEFALGSLVDGGVGQDCVGELFLRIIPDLEKPYQLYITKHSGALQHLHNLTQTSSLQAYLSHTQSVASSMSHAWDLASLLIKPVQRLLKYPLLLHAIIDETPDSHPDKGNLRQARTMMEEVVRKVNEVRRRAEIIKDVLKSKKKPGAVALSVNLGKLKDKIPPVNEDSEAGQVERMSRELKRIELFAQLFTKNIVDWARSMNKFIGALRTWSIGFGKVIGLSPEQGSKAFEAFLEVVERELMPLCVDLEAIIHERVLREIVYLLKTMNQPYKLLEPMTEQEPLYYHLLSLNVSAKSRPPQALLAASTTYLALRAQLAAELPTYLALLHQGLSISIKRLAYIQTLFWKDVKDKWGELWEMLRVDGELNAGHEETVIVWRSRWMDVNEVFASLNINQSRKIYQEPGPTGSSGTSVHPNLAKMEYPLPQVGRKQSSNMVMERPTHGRNKSGSITSFFKGDKNRGDRVQGSSPVPNLPEPDSRYMSHSNRDQWVTKPAKYSMATCTRFYRKRVIRAFIPSYRSMSMMEKTVCFSVEM
ncbi:hypothetical protein EST38_g13083 [Candolleomyces aberdarensis]|uniref:DH domain-containing protein n=1 Tax=Candolleomyces aberdarensis TaxID=2316362 RepID=A0A4Q2D0S5_9AGAR|nr:hypothetical protein EST38_g13083 [Candolleomyces aberdarensis]